VGVLGVLQRISRRGTWQAPPGCSVLLPVGLGWVINHLKPAAAGGGGGGDGPCMHAACAAPLLCCMAMAGVGMMGVPLLLASDMAGGLPLL
jgi:hypothetical protein